MRAVSVVALILTFSPIFLTSNNISYAASGVAGASRSASPALPVPGYSYPAYGYPGYSYPGYGASPGISPYTGTPYIYQQTPYPYYRSPYGYSTPNYGGSPYYGTPVSVPQSYVGQYYGLTFGGNSLRLWKANSGYYYPWVGGYGYNGYPIFVLPQGQTTPTATLPPVSVLVSDLDDYLDKSKEKGKVSEGDYTSLKRRANDLLSKEKSLAYEAGGSIDPDQEAGIRRDIEELSGEVAHRVQP